jgi:hypothetical protein
MKHIKTFEDLSNDKPHYDFELFKPFIELFFKCFEDDMVREGWTICYSQEDIPGNIVIEYSNRKGTFWQVQKDFESNLLNSDEDADVYAKNCGLLIDGFGVVIGYDNISFLENPEKIDDVMKELEIYKNLKKYNL